MKLLRVNSIYPAYRDRFYARNPQLLGASYKDQEEAFAHDAFSWGDAWVRALRKAGYEACEVLLNALPMQQAWAREKGLKLEDPTEILLRQIAEFRPDILWYDNDDPELIALIRKRAPYLRLVLGWIGSPHPKAAFWQHIDLMLSCAPEMVERIRATGNAAEHLDHSFDPEIVRSLEDRPRESRVEFVGQIVRGKEFHLERERILEGLVDQLDLTIHSPAVEIGFARDVARTAARSVFYGAAWALGQAHVPGSAIARIPLVSKAARWESFPKLSVSLKLRPHLRPGVFGREMLQTLKDAAVVLNIHADSSPRYASNMRLFEATSVGSCLLTDWRENLPELFEPDKEIMTYRSVEECVDKAKWLLANPSKRAAIAEAGRVRAWRDHSIDQRARRLDELIQKRVRATG
jgi:hypothetical protein